MPAENDTTCTWQILVCKSLCHNLGIKNLGEFFVCKEIVKEVEWQFSTTMYLEQICSPISSCFYGKNVGTFQSSMIELPIDRETTLNVN